MVSHKTEIQNYYVIMLTVYKGTLVPSFDQRLCGRIGRLKMNYEVVHLSGAKTGQS